MRHLHSLSGFPDCMSKNKPKLFIRTHCGATHLAINNIHKRINAKQHVYLGCLVTNLIYDYIIECEAYKYSTSWCMREDWEVWSWQGILGKYCICNGHPSININKGPVSIDCSLVVGSLVALWSVTDLDQSIDSGIVVLLCSAPQGNSLWIKAVA